MLAIPHFNSRRMSVSECSSIGTAGHDRHHEHHAVEAAVHTGWWCLNWVGSGAGARPVGASPLLGWEPAGLALVESRRTPVSCPLIAEKGYLNVCTCDVEVGI